MAADADDSLASLLDAFPPVDFAFAYGSAVVPQANYTAAQREAAMVDLVFAVDAPAAWHDANLAVHAAHYSAAGWIGGGAGAAALQERWGAGIYYNPLVRVRGRLLKYGVIRAATLRDDLRHWSTLYVSGRMHKPVRVLADRTEGVASLANANRRSALTAALLMLPQELLSLPTPSLPTPAAARRESSRRRADPCPLLVGRSFRSTRCTPRSAG